MITSLEMGEKRTYSQVPNAKGRNVVRCIDKDIVIVSSVYCVFVNFPRWRSSLIHLACKFQRVVLVERSKDDAAFGDEECCWGMTVCLV